MKHIVLTITGLTLWAGAAWAGPTTVAACGAFPADGGTLECSCTGTETGTVWGSGPYTADSNLCVAARHAGVVDSRGGVVSAYAVEGQSAYQGSSQNGVETSTWGAYGASFDFARQQQACGAFPGVEVAYSCACTGQEAGSVWGSGPYTADSNLCVAAIHAGVIGRNGGPISVLGITGLEQYSASQMNGVSTSAWGRYGNSIVFNQN